VKYKSEDMEPGKAKGFINEVRIYQTPIDLSQGCQGLGVHVHTI
jgi:hypothetical protein